MRLAARFGYITIIIIAMSIQALGVLIPTFTVNPLFIVLSGVFYGGTFVGLVALFMSLGGKLAGSNPVILMGALTTAYGIGQVIAPLYAVVLTDWSGNYNYALYVTAIIIIGGILLLLGAKKSLRCNTRFQALFNQQLCHFMLCLHKCFDVDIFELFSLFNGIHIDN